MSVAFINLTPDRTAVGKHPQRPGEQLRRMLAWRYGPDTAALILFGLHEPTNADIAAWRRLGRPE